MEVVRTRERERERERGREREKGTATIMPCAKRVDVVAFRTQRKNMRVQRNCIPFYGIIQNLIRSYRDSLLENPIRIFDLMIFRSKGFATRVDGSRNIYRMIPKSCYNS